MAMMKELTDLAGPEVLWETVIIRHVFDRLTWLLALIPLVGDEACRGGREIAILPLTIQEALDRTTNRRG